MFEHLECILKVASEGINTMSNIAFLFLPLAFSSFPAVLPFVSPSSQVTDIDLTPLEIRHGI